jgi:hypothetical protein
MHCSKKPKPPKEKKSKYAGPLLADLGNREVSCLVHFPKLECLVCEGMEVTGPRKELDWVTCNACDDAFHLQCLDPPLANRPNSFRCLSCKESKRKCIIPKEKKTKPLYTGAHDDDCFICRNGGNLVCCDFCEKVSMVHIILVVFLPCTPPLLNLLFSFLSGVPPRMPYSSTSRSPHYRYVEVL